MTPGDAKSLEHFACTKASTAKTEKIKRYNKEVALPGKRSFFQTLYV